MKKIALIVDTENWVFESIARNIKKCLSQYFDFKIIPIVNFDNNVVKVLIEAQDCDIIHFFWRGILLQINSEEYKRTLENMNLNIYEFNVKYLYNKTISFSIPDHLFLDNNLDVTNKIISTYPNYYVTSEKLYKIYNKISEKNKPYGIISDGVDLEKFYPMKKDKYKNINNRNIIIGWAGNSAWNLKEEDYKGVHTILKPVIKELQNEEYPIEIKYADKNLKMIPKDKMIDFYNDIDILVCTSKHEGTPCTVLEAMACKNVIISTDVGVVPEVLGTKQSKFILRERTKECLKERIIYLIKHREMFEELSNENLDRIKKWDTKDVFKKLKEYYDFILKENNKEYLEKMMNMELRKYNEELEKEIKELKIENEKYKLQLKAYKLQNDYMMSNIKKLKNTKINKIIRFLKKIIKKIFFWRNK